jgi:hypothetical protein
MTESEKENRLLRTAEGLQILAKYAGPFDIGAEHDILYAGPLNGEGVNEEDQEKLKALGWHLDMEAGGWAIFV